MKAIINNKKYDTETAEELGRYSNHFGSSDFRAMHESLYKTRNGRYFLAGSGGPMSKYSRPVGNMTGGGEEIIPLSENEAYEWAEEHLSAEEVEKLFPERIIEA